MADITQYNLDKAGNILRDIILNNHMFPKDFEITLGYIENQYPGSKKDTREIIKIMTFRDTYNCPSSKPTPMQQQIMQNRNQLSQLEFAHDNKAAAYDWANDNFKNMKKLSILLSRRHHFQIVIDAADSPDEIATCLDKQKQAYNILAALIQGAPIPDDVRDAALRDLATCKPNAKPVDEKPATEHKPVTTPAATKPRRTSSRGINAEIERLCMMQEHKLCPTHFCKKKSLQKNKFIFDLGADVFDDDFDLILNDTENHRLVVIHIPAKTYRPDDFYYWSTQNVWSIHLRPGNTPYEFRDTHNDQDLGQFIVACIPYWEK